MEFRPLSRYFMQQNWLRLLISIITRLTIVFFNIEYIAYTPFFLAFFFISKSEDKFENLFNLYLISQSILFVIVIINEVVSIKYLLDYWGFWSVSYLITNAFYVGFITSLLYPIIAIVIHEGVRRILINLNIIDVVKEDKYYERHDIIKSGNKELTR